ncbi:metal-binding protein [Pyrococcus furiosus DSM 3638]|uniref:Metal-binding protein n=3 Tax=Pyrococcus furiosus TaxID=2261 RepID=Q8U0T9_PYRFU|nr:MULTISPECIES: DUF2284 domain-containing protein [Pyrococcus]AAL81617.1 hypothetical protein PF1493 [Pyrococcus furiosus DSM 3638]AFN04276.1 hypothetical protein PFC_06700 [Pyrococcus furiosus COM1]MDK2870611.1 hypothetical protein [Pyrococcus sp.]QEK79120.1 metal-binding protein [Pyrococcus furiosus DSM 3638]
MKVLWIKEINAKDIKVSPRPVWKCRTCPMYGKRPSCPPHVPEWKEGKALVSSYEKALLVKFEIDTEHFENEKREVLRWLLNKEKELFREGYYYALALFPGNCNLCEECSFEKSRVCVAPHLVRPSIDAIGIELTSITDINFNERVLYGLILMY